VFGVRFIRSGAGPALLLLGEPCAGMSGCGMTPALVIAHRRLKALGVQIAMDDFGTGYSSLATFQAFPFDKIKIDRFVGKLEVQPQAAVIVRAVLGLGRSLGMGVVAEACDEVQGYFFGRPQPIEQFAHAIYGKSPAWTEKAA
jgi:EAL domain-containing protein (putative c-di-GMP-specific phosphodiesterase class I)